MKISNRSQIFSLKMPIFLIKKLLLTKIPLATLIPPQKNYSCQQLKKVKQHNIAPISKQNLFDNICKTTKFLPSKFEKERLFIPQFIHFSTDPSLNSPTFVPRKPIPTRVEKKRNGNRKTEGTNPQTFGRKVRKQRRRFENGLERDRDSGPRNVGSL